MRWFNFDGTLVDLGRDPIEIQSCGSAPGHIHHDHLEGVNWAHVGCDVKSPDLRYGPRVKVKMPLPSRGGGRREENSLNGGCARASVSKKKMAQVGQAK
jgi:hypothetical protein